MEENEIQDLKLRINQFVWENGPPAMTLEEAEKAACAMLEAMVPVSVEQAANLLNDREDLEQIIREAYMKLSSVCNERTAAPEIVRVCDDRAKDILSRGLSR